MKAKPPVPLWRWGLWWVLLALGMFIFYVALTPLWVGLRALAWVAEFRARRQSRSARGQSPPARST